MADENENLPATQRLRWVVYAHVRNAVRSGHLDKPTTCQRCGGESGSERLETHHHNGYAREHWLDVIWLCISCHKQVEKPPTCLRGHPLDGVAKAYNRRNWRRCLTCHRNREAALRLRRKANAG